MRNGSCAVVTHRERCQVRHIHHLRHHRCLVLLVNVVPAQSYFAQRLSKTRTQEARKVLRPVAVVVKVALKQSHSSAFAQILCCATLFAFHAVKKVACLPLGQRKRAHDSRCILLLWLSRLMRRWP